jgi:hypothetical protein
MKGDDVDCRVSLFGAIKALLFGHKKKAIMVFDLEDYPEDFDAAMKGVKYMMTLYRFYTWLRGQIKYGDYSEENEELLEKVRTELLESLDENGLNLDDVY